jgi:hypothetical protein
VVLGAGTPLEARRGFLFLYFKEEKMDSEIILNPEDVLNRIIKTLASEHRLNRGEQLFRDGYNRPFWTFIQKLTTYGMAYSSHLAVSHGFDADTAELLTEGKNDEHS